MNDESVLFSEGVDIFSYDHKSRSLHIGENASECIFAADQIAQILKFIRLCSDHADGCTEKAPSNVTID